MPPEIAKLLWDMRHAAERIERFTAGKTLDDYVRDDMLRSAVERQFEIVGEAIGRLVKSAPSVAAQITDYRRISGFRNVLIHGYDAIDDVISWDILQDELPILRRELEALLRPGAP